MRHALCAMPYAPHPMRHALCAMPYAPCPMRHALCATPYAPYPMRHTLCAMRLSPAHKWVSIGGVQLIKSRSLPDCLLTYFKGQ